ncbi:centromere-associated protein E isoform X13 [Anguilla rostrata]|uniref:centromere-associated protein E isoform X13 n=1 Tax=Anguilla rostrata TaxID=7938 RepID=UPI0030D05297
MTEESAVKVCVRVRPLIQREEASTENSEPVALYWKADKQAIHQIDDGSVTKTFSFDRVFSAEESTNQLYQDIAKPLVVSAVEGYNGTIFAYGQTSSGKTFTMMGSNRIPGVIPLAMEDVFQTIKNCPKKEFLLRVSYMEIYNETVTDLLCDSWKRKPLEIREGNYKNVYVADLTEELVTSAEQALSWIRKGEKNRHYGKTKMNQRSSRSHTIFRMILESRERSDPASGENADGAIIVSHLNLVDLAGAERASQTGAEGARLKEGCNINRSLFTLGQVIKKLSDENQGGFTNYRDSKLTRILQNSLGGNAKTVIICTITPATVEETISTLQFASAAKRMKNDPHVTEVSDDGALLRRYRNEIVDLKRRLQEVSSVTQTTATEKEVLAQLLQEKDQLQREQQDRIRNLTKIIVTSSNFVVAEKKVPKRRVTWGGKLFRPVQSGDFHIGDAEFGPSEPSVKKRKADLSVLLEQDDDSTEFDSQWETPDDIQFDIEMNQSNVTIRSVTDSDFPSPSRLGELSEKVASLEMQLQMETQQKQEAVEMSSSLEKRVAELEKQLEVQEQELLKDPQEEELGEPSEKVASLEMQLQMETQQKQEAVEMSTSLEKRVAELEKQLEVQEQELLKDPQEEYKKDLGDTIQLCEALVSEKANIAAERDLIKQELSILKDENLLLRRDKDHLLKEIEEKREMQEFSSLEQESAKQYEIELLAEISSIKKVAEKSVACVQKLEADMSAMSTLLKRKEEVIKELQNINGKDLVQENQQLRRSLADAEELSRETKKEWAFLRSDNLSLKERDSSMSTDYEKMKNEVTALCSKLEVEKSRFKKMQVDLQKELQGAFEENTKLTTLLDGKVPKNLIDSIELERTVTGLKKELEMHQEQESFLQSKVEELEALKDLPVQVESLKKQICDLTEELCAARAEKDCLLSAQTSSDAEIGRLTAEVQQAQDQLAEAQAKLSDAEIREDHLSQQHLDITQQAEELKAELKNLTEEKCQLLNTVEELNMKAERSREHETSIEGKLLEQQLLVKDLENKLEETQESSTHAEEHFKEISKQHQDQITQLNEELQLVRSERDALQSERTNTGHLSEEEQEKLRSHVTSLTEERDQLQEILEGVREDRNQLKVNLQEKEEMVVQIHEELRQQKHLASEHEALGESEQAELQQQIQQLNEELEGVKADRSQLKCDMQENVEMMIENQDELRAAQDKIRKQQEVVQDLKTQILQLKSKLVNVNGAEDNLTNLEDLQDQIKQLSEELQLVRSERDALLSERTNAGHVSEEEREKLCSHITSLTEERDQLQEILEGVREDRNQLKRELQEKEEMSVEGQAELLSAQEELKLQQQLNSDLQAQISEKESQLEQITQLSEELQLVCSERDALQSERTNTGHLSEEEQEKLRSQVTSLTEERDQLQEILEGVREERNQLKRELQEKEEMSVEGQAELLSAQEDLKLQQQLNSDLQAQISEKESQLQEITQLSEELQLVRSERDALQSERTNTGHLSEEEQEKLCSQVTSLTEERDQLQEILEGVREERNQLKRDLQEKEEVSVEGQAELLSAQEELKLQQQLNSDLQAQISEKESRLEQQVAQVQEELRQQQHLNSEHQALREREQAELHQQIQQLTAELEGVREERTKLQSDLQENTEMAKETQNLLHSIQEDLKQQQVLNADLKTQNSEIETRLEQQITQLSEELQLVRSERDALQSERTNTTHLSEEEQEKLHSQVTSLTEERDQLQEVLEGVREERSQLKRDLLEKEEMLAQVQKQLLEKGHLNAEQQTLREKEQAEFQQQIQKLAEELEGVREECQQKAELEKASQEALSEANAAIASLREQIRDLEEKSSPAGQGGERLRARLEESELELQKVLEKFQKFADSAAGALKSLEQPLKDASLVQNELAFQVLASIPKPLRALYVEFRKSTDGISDLLWRTARGSAGVAQLHRQQLEAQASQDAACFEESRLQDLLIRAAGDPGDLLAATSDDFRQVWDQRLHELLERREQKLQEMNSVLAELEEGVARNAATVSEELPEQQRTNEELRALVTAPTLDLAALESLLERERARRTLVLQSKKAVFLNLQNEYFKMGSDLKAFKAQASQQLKEERSRSLTLLQKRESGPAKSEAELLQSLQELTLKLQQSETLVKAVQTRAGELEEAQARAEDRVSKHKEATQLLQTELQDVCAQLKEKEGAVRGLEGMLRESEAQVKRGMAPSAVELDEMKNKLIKMELELTARASTHQEELEKMTSMLDHKEEALRKLKEALRKTQQQGDESFMEESIYAKGTATIGGRTVQSSIVMEKNRLEEEVKQLKKKIVQLESLISSQQLEITKWKTRATKLKENRKEGVKAEMPLSPHTPTKRRRPITSEGHILDSPKSKFFDARSVSESVSANCPKQFFDNSTLGNVPEVLYPPTMPELGSPESPEIDLNAAVEDKNAEWWPMSPTQSDNCKTQ